MDLLADRFRLGERIGRGSVSEVYQAVDEQTGREVAVKLAPADPELARRYQEEAAALSLIASPHVVELLSAGSTADGRAYLVLERLRGKNLQQLLVELGQVPPRKVAEWMAHAASALELAHGLGIVHRDLKPANLFLHGNTVKVLDFGMRVDAHGPTERLHDAFGGTPLYMAPEQVRGQLSRIGPATDVWALAMVAVSLLTGEAYWDGTSVPELLGQIERSPTTAPSKRWPWLGPGFDAWFARSTQRVPDRRYQSADEQARQLELALREITQPRRSVSKTLAAIGNASTVTPRQATVPAEPKVASVVGREVELAEIQAQLAPGKVVTLTGTAGSGKSALAQAVGVLAAEAYGDGAWFVPLRASEQVVSAIRAALHLAHDPAAGEYGGLVAQLGSRSLLLVLDGAEQVSGAAGIVADLVARCPTVAWLVTSRLPLGIDGERTLGIGPLELPPGEVSADEALTFAAIELFARRAREADPAFVFDDGSVADVVAICRHLDGFPHAIELAAAQLARSSPAQVREELEHRQAHDVQAAIAWSYGLLGPAEQQLLRQLAVFPAGLPRQGLELGQLGHSRLVTVDDERVQIFDSVRELCRRLSAALGEEATLWRVARRHVEQLAGSSDLDLLDREHDNIRAVLAWLLEREPQAALALAGRLTWYWYLRGHYAEGFATLETAIDRSKGDSDALVRALHGAGRLALLRCRYQRAEELLSRARALASQRGDVRGEADAVQLLGSVARERGDCAAAQALHRRGLELWQQLGDAREAARARNYLTFAAWLGGLPQHEPVEVIDLGDPEILVWSLLNAGAIQHHSGGSARDTIRRAFAESIAARFNEGIAWSLELAGRASQERGELIQAHAQLSSALRVHRQLSDLWRCASVLEALAGVAVAEGDLERAATILGGADELRELIAAPVPVVERRALAKVESACAGHGDFRRRGRRLPLDRIVKLARER